MELLYFILGSIFMVVITPLLSTIVEIIDSYSQLIIYKIAFKIWDYKQKMGVKDQIVQDQEVSNIKIPMGFHSDLIGVQIESVSIEEKQEEEI